MDPSGSELFAEAELDPNIQYYQIQVRIWLRIQNYCENNYKPLYELTFYYRLIIHLGNYLIFWNPFCNENYILFVSKLLETRKNVKLDLKKGCFKNISAPDPN